MTIIDKRGVLENVGTANPVELELGCGPSKRSNSAIGIDVLDYDCVDVVGDALEVLDRLPEASVRRVFSSHFMEHLPDLKGILNALSRVLMDGGTLHITVPHFSNPHYYSDPTHKTPFGLYTFSYFCKDEVFRRKVPNYKVAPHFSVEHVRLGFKSYRPNYFRHAMKLAWGSLLNQSTWLTELYEENLCWLVPAYEISYVLRRLPRESTWLDSSEPMAGDVRVSATRH